MTARVHKGADQPRKASLTRVEAHPWNTDRDGCVARVRALLNEVHEVRP